MKSDERSLSFGLVVLQRRCQDRRVSQETFVVTCEGIYVWERLG